jgi:hypothetical protein
MSRLCLVVCLACLAAGQGVASAGPVTFVVTNTSRLGTLDLGTGAFTAIGAPHPGGYDGLGNLPDGTLTAVDGSNNFVAINRTTGVATLVGPTGASLFISGSLTSGAQFALDTSNNFYRINPTTGAATLVGPTGLPAFSGNVANGLGGNATSLYYLFEQTGAPAVTSSLYQINTTTGAATFIGLTGTRSLVGAGFDHGIFYGYSNDVPVVTTHRIFSVNLATGAATGGATFPQNVSIFGSDSGVAVPEPASLLLVSLGTIGMLGYGRRRRAANV